MSEEESLTKAFLADLDRAEQRMRGAGGKAGVPVGALAGELEASRAAWERHQSTDSGEEMAA